MALLETIRENNTRIQAIIYTPRKGTSNILQDFLVLNKESGILIIDATKLASPRKKKSPEFAHELSEVHPEESLEIRLINTVLNNEKALSALVKTKRGKKSKPFPRHL